MIRFRVKNIDQNGFTIVELMIATVVFSMVLIVLTMGVTQITSSYYRGVTDSNTQVAARNVINTITQAIQFNGGPVDATPQAVTAGTTYGFCIGNQEYDFQLGYEVEGSNTASPPLKSYPANHGLVVTDNVVACPNLSNGPTNSNLVGISSLASGSRELLTQNMRLSELSVTQSSPGSDLYNVIVQVTYGDDDLICNADIVANSCSPNAPIMSAPSDYIVNLGDSNDQVSCRGNSGTQFCAVSKLQTTVEKRLP
jgi:prepilin-type N-terminal cleavage/methylation domain-containing protein